MPNKNYIKKVSTLLFQGKASDFGAYSRELLDHREMVNHQVYIVASGSLASGIYKVRFIPDEDTVVESTVDTGEVLDMTAKDSAYCRFVGMLKGIHLEVDTAFAAGDTISVVVSSYTKVYPSESTYLSTQILDSKASDFGSFSATPSKHGNMLFHQLSLASSGTLAAGAYSVRLIPDVDEVLETSVDIEETLDVTGLNSAYVQFDGVMKGVELKVSTPLTGGETISVILSSSTEQFDTLILAAIGGTTDHTMLTNIGSNSHVQIDSHIADATLHFTEASIDHLNIQNIGSNSHAAIDTHMAIAVEATNPFGTDERVIVADGTGRLSKSVPVTIDSSGNIITPASVTVLDEAYAAGWDASEQVPTKNAVYDKIESLAAADIDVNSINACPYDDLEKWLDVNLSNGLISGGDITDGGSGTIDVSTGCAMIRDATSDVATLYSSLFPAQTGIALTDQVTNFVYVEWNAGTPQVVASVTPRDSSGDNLLIGLVVRDGTDVHITHTHTHTTQFNQIASKKSALAEGVVRQSGSVTAETGNRLLTVTAGVWWLAYDEYTTPALDTSAAGTFTYLYQDGVGGWTEVASSTTIDNGFYDDTTGTLAALTGARRGVHWLYLGAEGDYYVVYGLGNYTLNQAQDATPPATLPPYIAEFHAALIAKIIVGNGDTNLESVQNPFDTVFGTSVASDHGDLAGLTDDDHTQYVLADGTRTHDLEDLSDVTITSITTGDLLRWSGAAWVNYADSNYAASGHTHLLATGATDVTASAAQVSLMNVNGTTANRALITDGANFASWQQIPHSILSGIGSNSHAQIDSHISDSTLHFTEGSIDHGSIGGLGDDDHTQYVLADGTRDITGDQSVDGTLYVGDTVLAPDNFFYLYGLDANTPAIVFDDADRLTYDRTANEYSFVINSLPQLTVNSTQVDLEGNDLVAAGDISGSGDLDMSGILKNIPATGITAFAGGGQASATQLTEGWNEVNTVVTDGDSVKLPSAAAGLEVTVHNDSTGGKYLDLFPNNGDSIEDNSLNTAYAIPPNTTIRLYAWDTTNWKVASSHMFDDQVYIHGMSVQASNGIGCEDDASEWYIGGGSNPPSGGGMHLYGPAHSTKPDTLELLYGSTIGATLNGSGKFGINETSPDVRVHVKDDTGAYSATNIDTNALLKLENSGNTDNDAVGISFVNHATSGQLKGCAIMSERVSSTASELVFITSLASTPAERMRIDSSGNVGIGTTSPTYPLVVSEAEGAGYECAPSTASGFVRHINYNRTSALYVDALYDALNHRIRINGSEKVTVNSAGNVGINIDPSISSILWGGNAELSVSSSIGISRWGTSGSADLYFTRSRHATKGSHTALNNGDNVMFMAWAGSDGTDFNNDSGWIRAKVDSTPAANSVPTRLEFATCGTGNSTGTLNLTVEADGDVTVENGNLVIGTSGSGIDFSAAAGDASGMDAEILNDYEEGTWTPVISDASAHSATMNIQVGTYVKIGKQVTCKFRLSLTNKDDGGGALSGSLRLEGLPFTSDSLAQSQGSMHIGYCLQANITASESLCGYMPTNGTRVLMRLWDHTGGNTDLQDTEINATCSMMGIINYEVA